MNFYILGYNPALSLAEFFAVYPSAKAVVTSETILVCDESGPDPKEAVARLAGVVKAGVIVASEFQLNELDQITDAAYSLVSSRAKASAEAEGSRDSSASSGYLPDSGRNDTNASRVEFGLSLYDGGNAPLFGTLKAEMNKVGMAVKRALEAEGRKVRLVTMKGDTLSSVAVTTQAKAGDVALVATAGGVLVGRTQAVQDFEAWSKRDFGRPSRDAKSGMLPPKLARMLVNLATTPSDLATTPSPPPSKGGGPEGLVLLDPFCGSGTVPMEAMLMGFKAVIASDISPKAVSDTGRNLEWVRKEFAQAKTTRVSVYEADAADLASYLPLTKGEHEGVVDAVATETYLGAPLTGRESLETLKKNMAVLGQSYAKMFAGVFAVMKPGSKAVVAFPAFVHAGKTLHLPLNTILAPIGFVIEKSFLYERKGQKVAREILVMRKSA